MGVPALSDALARLHVTRKLINIRFDDEELSLPDRGLVETVMVKGYRFETLRLTWSPSLRKILEDIFRSSKFDLFHSHGVWSYANHEMISLALDKRMPYVVTPHGCLTKWSMGQKAWKKKLAWRLYQKKDMQNANAIHSTAESEARDLRELGLTNPIAIIPNGVEIPEWEEKPRENGEIHTLLFLSRLHPKKGLLNLVEAWSLLRPKGWK